MNFLKKIQDLSEEKRKTIRLLIVIVISFALFFFWIKSLSFTIKSFDAQRIKEQFKIPEFKEKLEGMPKMEIPEFEKVEIGPEEQEKLKKVLSEEEIKQLEEIMKKIEKQE